MFRAFSVLGLLLAITIAAVTIVSRASVTPRSETEVALAYACGYRAGQIAVMRDLPALFPAGALTTTDTCQEMKVIAARHGFTQ